MVRLLPICSTIISESSPGSTRRLYAMFWRLAEDTSKDAKSERSAQERVQHQPALPRLRTRCRARRGRSDC
jgi:hypothetical protein